MAGYGIRNARDLFFHAHADNFIDDIAFMKSL